jgi:hypothetical protein
MDTPNLSIPLLQKPLVLGAHPGTLNSAVINTYHPSCTKVAGSRLHILLIFNKLTPKGTLPSLVLFDVFSNVKISQLKVGSSEFGSGKKAPHANRAIP